MLPASELSLLRQFIEEIALESGELIRPYFWTDDLQIEEKADESPVTQADKKAELLLRERIESKFPSHGIIGEEYGNVREDAEFVWVLDPIDGTKSFAARNPLFGTLIGLLHNGEPLLGCIHQPILSQLLIGDNELSRLNSKQVRLRECSSLAEATLLTTDRLNVEKYQSIENFSTLEKRCKMVRTWGDCYGYLMVARGGADIMIDPILNPWDLLPLIPVIRGAGGSITDYAGNPATKGDSAIACHPSLLSNILKILHG